MTSDWQKASSALPSSSSMMLAWEPLPTTPVTGVSVLLVACWAMTEPKA